MYIYLCVPKRVFKDVLSVNYINTHKISTKSKKGEILADICSDVIVIFLEKALTLSITVLFFNFDFFIRFCLFFSFSFIAVVVVVQCCSCTLLLLLLPRVSGFPLNYAQCRLVLAFWNKDRGVTEHSVISVQILNHLRLFQKRSTKISFVTLHIAISVKSM